MTDQTATILATLRQRAAAGYLWLGLVADELEELQDEVDELQKQLSVVSNKQLSEKTGCSCFRQLTTNN